ncbi:MAG: DUF2723 domain-containing protein [Chloroflexi bacterium]|nr:DUF2723 domain-containing protein [Chloroflexota bacterium]
MNVRPGSPRDSRCISLALRWLPPAAVGALAFALYASTAAPWLTWAHDGADGGDLITAAMNWGVPHPSGYPTYCLLGRLCALVPLGTVARRFNLLSAGLAAVTAALLCLCARLVLRASPLREGPLESVVAAGVALTWATGKTIWSQAVITEVYTLLSLFAALCLYLALHEAWPARAWRWGAMGLVFGLGTGAHLTVLLMAPGLAVLLWPNLSRRRLLAAALGLFLGLSVHLYLPLAAREDPVTNWGDPRTWEGFWWLVSGQPYRQYLLGLPIAHLLSRLRALARLWAEQHTWIGLSLSLLGLWSWIEGDRRRWAAGTGLIALAFLIHALTYDTTDSYVYLLPFFLVSALWMAEGLRALLLDHAPALGKGRVLCAGVALALLWAMPLWSLHRNYGSLNLAHDGEVAAWTEAVLEHLPEGALLVTGQDGHTFALDYVQWVENRRQDVVAVDGELLAYPWYTQQLRRRHAGFPVSSPQLSLPELIAPALEEGRTVYLASPRPELADRHRIERVGVLYRVTER